VFSYALPSIVSPRTVDYQPVAHNEGLDIDALLEWRSSTDRVLPPGFVAFSCLAYR
jgi:hypothetical protein